MSKEWLMRTLKMGLVIAFCLAPLAPLVSTRVAALTVALAQNKTSIKKSGEKPGKAQTSAQTKSGRPVDASQYVGGESCAECHGAEATHYALTAHSKTN